MTEPPPARPSMRPNAHTPEADAAVPPVSDHDAASGPVSNSPQAPPQAQQAQQAHPEASIHTKPNPKNRDPWLGRVVHGRYHIEERIGEGGMGCVYRAKQDVGVGTRPVAIKMLIPSLRDEPTTVARFRREAEVVLRLSHPNTIHLYDAGELADGTLFIAMEYIDGDCLADLVSAGPIEATRIPSIVGQICGSLSEAHALGIVHRDLKPENIMLCTRGRQTDFVKVLDFGIARPEPGGAASMKLTRQGALLGTPPYMSPEQFSGRALDARSDLYALGLVIYEMVTGQLPFDAETAWEWATHHLRSTPKAIDAYPEGRALAPHQREAIHRTLAKSPDDRFADVESFWRAFSASARPLTSPGLPRDSSPQAMQVSQVRSSSAAAPKDVDAQARGQTVSSRVVEDFRVTPDTLPGSKRHTWPMVAVLLGVGGTVAAGWWGWQQVGRMLGESSTQQALSLASEGPDRSNTSSKLPAGRADSIDASGDRESLPPSAQHVAPEAPPQTRPPQTQPQTARPTTATPRPTRKPAASSAPPSRDPTDNATALGSSTRTEAGDATRPGDDIGADVGADIGGDKPTQDETPSARQSATQAPSRDDAINPDKNPAPHPSSDVNAPKPLVDQALEALARGSLDAASQAIGDARAELGRAHPKVQILQRKLTRQSIAKLRQHAREGQCAEAARWMLETGKTLALEPTEQARIASAFTRLCPDRGGP